MDTISLITYCSNCTSLHTTLQEEGLLDAVHVTEVSKRNTSFPEGTEHLCFTGNVDVVDRLMVYLLKNYPHLETILYLGYRYFVKVEESGRDPISSVWKQEEGGE